MAAWEAKKQEAHGLPFCGADQQSDPRVASRATESRMGLKTDASWAAPLHDSRGASDWPVLVRTHVIG